MKNLFKLFLSFFPLFIFYNVDATVAPGKIDLVLTSDTSVELDWQDVDDILGYYIYYGEASGIDAPYDVEGVDLIETSNYTITDLEPTTEYFIAVTAVDDTGSESEKSPELEVVTLAAGEPAVGPSLRIIEANVIDDSSVELVFSVDMETGNSAQREFIIENIVSGTEIGVDISDVVPGQPKNILVILDQGLEANTGYKVTVLDIRDKDGNTIESGIDAFVNFTTPSVFETAMESAGAETTNTTEDTTIMPEDDNIGNSEQDETVEEQDTIVDQNTQENTTKAGTELIGNNAGTTISSDDLAGNTLNAAAENQKLPETGPEHWILLLITVMLSTAAFYKFRK